MNELNTKIVKYYATKASEIREYSEIVAMEKMPLTFCRMRDRRQSGNGGYIGVAKTFNSYFNGKEICYGKNDKDIETGERFYSDCE